MTRPGKSTSTSKSGKQINRRPIYAVGWKQGNMPGYPIRYIAADGSSELKEYAATFPLAKARADELNEEMWDAADLPQK